MNILKYNTDHKRDVLNLLRLNTPQYFSPEEEDDYINYLEQEIEDYFVVEVNSKIVAAGGINYFTNHLTARIAWDLVSPDHQGKGIGQFLTSYRIQHIKKNSTTKEIIVRTSQHACKFYEKSGFELEKIEKDFWAEGFDLYLMRLTL